MLSYVHKFYNKKSEIFEVFIVPKTSNSFHTFYVDFYRDMMIAECKGKLNFGEQTDKEKQGNTEGVNKITEAPFTKRCNKIRMIPGPVKRVSHPQGVQKSSLPLRSAARLSTGQISMKSCAKSAISFSKQQMYDAECLTMKLTNELKSMKDIMADMMRSELCLTTSLRYKLNEV